MNMDDNMGEPGGHALSEISLSQNDKDYMVLFIGGI